jgi:hypothetical protein
LKKNKGVFMLRQFRQCMIAPANQQGGYENMWAGVCILSVPKPMARYHEAGALL